MATSERELSRLGRGDLLPKITVAPPGPRSIELSNRIERREAPGIGTLVDGRTLVWSAARGSNVLDVDGNRFVDLTAGFGAAGIGHAHPAVLRAIREQSERLVHGLGDVHSHPSRIALAERLAAWLPFDDPLVYFAVSGADAVEIALKTARLATGRDRVLAFRPSYHGLTLGALSLSGRSHFRQPFEKTLRPLVDLVPFAAPIETLREAIDAGDPFGAVVVEPIVGREGVLIPPDGWLNELSALCRSVGALLIVDEILTGFGRTGERFAVDREGVRPDLLVCGKALGGGMPIGVATGERELMNAWASPGEARHTATFVAHPLASAAALAALDVLEHEALVERARELESRIRARIASWDEAPPDGLVEIRGVGLLWGLECATADRARSVAAHLLSSGFLALAGGEEGTVVELTPPLSISEAQLDAALDAVETAFEA